MKKKILKYFINNMSSKHFDCLGTFRVIQRCLLCGTQFFKLCHDYRIQGLSENEN